MTRGAPKLKRAAMVQALDTACDDVVNQAFSPPPKTLAHYTKPAGLEGILCSQRLWATDFASQASDEREFRHAHDSLMEELCAVSRDPIVSGWGRERLTILERILQQETFAKSVKNSLFILSFCEEADSEHLWTNFADEGRGFSLEFTVLRDESADWNAGLLLTKVDYDPLEVRARARRLWLDVLTLAERFPRRHREHARFVTDRQLWMIAAKASVQYKPAEPYANEREWRRVAIVPGTLATSSMPVLTNPRRVEIPIHSPTIGTTLRAIHVGPSADARAEAFARDLLRANGFANAAQIAIARAKRLGPR